MISNCRASGNKRYGLLVRSDESEVKITGCTVNKNGEEGIYVKCGGQGLIGRNTAFDNGGNGIQVGSDLNGSFNIRNNRVNRNKKSGILAGNVKEMTIEENFSEDNEDRGMIVLTGSGKAVIRNNRCHGSGSYAIQVEKMSAQISGNELYDNYGGIHVINGTMAKVSQNRVAGCSEKPAITAEGVAEFEANMNECTYNDGVGIFVTARSHARVEENRCENNGGDGIQFNGEAAGSIVRNWCEGNFGNGMAVYRTAADVLMMNNRCLGNDASGIEVSGATNVVVKDNLITGNADHGLFIHKGARAKADGNKCESNNIYGINVDDATTSAMLQWNRCINNSRGGVMFAKSAGGEANGNMCSGNFWCGIGLYGEGTAPVLTKNRCNDNGAWGIIAMAGATLDGLPGDNIIEKNYKGGMITRGPTPDPNE